MCTVCGCSEGQTRLEGKPLIDGHQHSPGTRQHGDGYTHSHADDHHHHGHNHDHTHDHHHDHTHDHHSHGDQHAHHYDSGHTPNEAHTAAQGLHDYGRGPAGAHAPGLSQSRMVQIEQNILSKNSQYAQANRHKLQQQAVLALNLVSSPGSGKTTLLTRTLGDQQDEWPMQVIEGDQQTSHDADRIRATGAEALQINTGKGCHLDAHQVGHALDTLKPPAGAVLFIENVGNLVCPAAFDLGEAHKVAILSVTEGEDKPLKYPDMFHAASLMLINKIDLLPYVSFDLQRCIDYARQVNPSIQVLTLSATTGEGMEAWYQWLRLTRNRGLLGHPLAEQTAQPAPGQPAPELSATISN